MKLSEHMIAWVLQIENASENNRDLITDWELNFMRNFAERVHWYYEDTSCSEKQLAILNRVAEKLGFETKELTDLVSD